VDDGSGARTAGDGVGDTEIPHPFVDQGDSYYQLDNYPLINPVGNYIFLYPGWNLISIPFVQTITDLDVVLSSINGSYSEVEWFDETSVVDHWKHSSTTKPPALNDLSQLNHNMGFWIYITEPGGVLFRYFGMEPTDNQTIQLYPGWNMVGYPSFTSYNRTAGLNNLSFDTHVDAIWTYDTSTPGWKELGELDHFVAGRGYWIHAMKKCEWEVPM
jgi:hypothetical protein